MSKILHTVVFHCFFVQELFWNSDASYHCTNIQVDTQMCWTEQIPPKILWVERIPRRASTFRHAPVFSLRKQELGLHTVGIVARSWPIVCFQAHQPYVSSFGAVFQRLQREWCTTIVCTPFRVSSPQLHTFDEDDDSSCGILFLCPEETSEKFLTLIFLDLSPKHSADKNYSE